MWNAIAACASVLPHVSKDDVTPVITCASISGNTIVATDRYTVAEYTLHSSLPEGSILLPGEAVKWIARIVTKNLLDYPVVGHYTVTITGPDPDIFAGIPSDTDGTQSAHELAQATIRQAAASDEFNKQVLTVTVESETNGVEAMRAFRPVRGTFPPVARLLKEFKPFTEGDAPSGVLLGSAQLEKFTTWARRWYRDRPLRFEMSKSTDATMHAPVKPGPVRISIDRFRGLIQPGLDLQ